MKAGNQEQDIVVLPCGEESAPRTSDRVQLQKEPVKRYQRAAALGLAVALAIPNLARAAWARTCSAHPLMNPRLSHKARVDDCNGLESLKVCRVELHRNQMPPLTGREARGSSGLYD